jgi:hypothetical protein
VYVYGGEGGIRTPGGLLHNGFQDRRFKPLSHLSGGAGPSNNGTRWVQGGLIRRMAPPSPATLRIPNSLVATNRRQRGAHPGGDRGRSSVAPIEKVVTAARIPFALVGAPAEAVRDAMKPQIRQFVGVARASLRHSGNRLPACSFRVDRYPSRNCVRRPGSYQASQTFVHRGEIDQWQTMITPSPRVLPAP